MRAILGGKSTAHSSANLRFTEIRPRICRTLLHWRYLPIGRLEIFYESILGEWIVVMIECIYIVLDIVFYMTDNAPACRVVMTD